LSFFDRAALPLPYGFKRSAADLQRGSFCLFFCVGRRGTENACGWCKNRWGLSWQITPRAPTDALAAGGADAKRAFNAMMTMKKIDIAAIEAAR
jgi:hypothetical protein